MAAVAPDRLRCCGRFVAVAALAGPAVALLWHVLLQGRPGPVAPPLAWLLVGAPLLEELAFRGAVMPALARMGWRGFGAISFANGATAVLFAACHVPTHGVALAAATALPSLVFGRLAERSGVLWPAIAMHAWYNANFVLWVARG